MATYSPDAENQADSHIPLLTFTRGEFSEGVHFGCLAVVRSDGHIHASVGDYQVPVILRSGAKPFQLITVLASGAAECFGLSGKELAVAAGSHSAEPEHLEAVRSILSKIGLKESDLRCGVHAPFMDHVRSRMARADEQPSEIHNNCSGKHASMLAACIARGWPLDTYDLMEHPLQQENRRIQGIFSDLPESEIGVVIDGCGVPAFAMPLWRAALAYARFADPQDLPETEKILAERAMDAICANPGYGSGKTGRLEAALMLVSSGRIVAKVGAEGFYGVGIAPGVLGVRGYGLALKLREGITFNRANDPIVLSALRQLGVLGNQAVEQLSGFWPREVTNCRGERVGKVKVLFTL